MMHLHVNWIHSLRHNKTTTFILFMWCCYTLFSCFIDNLVIGNQVSLLPIITYIIYYTYLYVERRIFSWLLTTASKFDHHSDSDRDCCVCAACGRLAGCCGLGDGGADPWYCGPLRQQQERLLHAGRQHDTTCTGHVLQVY